MDFEIDQSAQVIKDLAIDFGRREVAPTLHDRARDRRQIPELLRRMGQTGLLGISMPTEYGGRGARALDFCMAAEGFGEGADDAGLAVAWGAHSLLCGIPIWKLGSAAQRRRFLPALCAGEIIAGSCLSDPEATPGSASVRLRARRAGSRWIVSGTCPWVVNAPVAQLFVIRALPEPAAHPRQVCTFIVDRDQKGLRAGSLVATSGAQTAELAELTFEDCEVSDEGILDLGEDGTERATRLALAWERAIMSAAWVGMMKAALDRAVSYAKEASSAGKPLRRSQSVRMSLFEMRIRHELCQRIVHRAAWSLDHPDGDTEQIAAEARLFLAEQAQTFARCAVSVHGDRGVREGDAAERGVRDAVFLGAGTGGAAGLRASIAAPLFRPG